MTNLTARLLKLAAFSLMILVLVSCGGKKDDHHDHSSDEAWKEMDDFHFVMAAAYHPLKESNDLEPAKKQAPALAEAAAKWADSKVPEKADNAEFKEKLSLLKAGCAEFVTIVQKNDSSEISESLTSLHGLFHEIQDKWYGHDHSSHDHDHGHDH
jgi:hypothetical protein